MKVASFVKATALFTAAAFVVSAGVAQAQVDKDNAKCRATAQKNTGKLTATASKATVGCWKGVFKSGTYVNCNDSATADTKSKISKTAGKLTSAVGGAKSKCDDTTHAASLAAYVDCPSPGTEGPGMTTFTQVGNCLAGVGQGMSDNMHRVAMNPGPVEIAAIAASPNLKQIAKCGNSIQKNFSKLIATVGKTEGKEQATSDKGGGTYDYSKTGADPKQKVSKTAGKLADAITKDCAVLDQNEFALLRTCGDLTDAAACLTEIAKNGSSGVTGVSFAMPGVCPGSVTVIARTRQSNGGAASATKLDAGWTGLGMEAELLTFTGDVNLNCSDGTCSECAVTVGCANGNCRCANDISTTCDEPFGPDADDCAGNTCRVLFGSPLALNASNTPTCLTTEIITELVGTADIGTGESETHVTSATKVHTGIAQKQPCPVCSGGTCDGGDNDGGACTDDGVSPLFGASSYDCPPAAASNVTGTGLAINLLFSDAPPDLTSTKDCTFASGMSGLACPCHVCTGDTTVPCNTDTDCDGVGGTCTSIGSGEHTQPSGCDDKTAGCTVDANGNGECNGGAVDEVNFCDGFLNPDGSGVLTCDTNADCASVSAGDCTIAAARKCMMNGDGSISTTGTFGGQEGAVLGGSFCAAPTASPAINGAAGTPGPARVAIAWRFDGLCPDGVTEYTLGGNSCP